VIVIEPFALRSTRTAATPGDDAGVVAVVVVTGTDVAVVRALPIVIGLVALPTVDELAMLGSGLAATVALLTAPDETVGVNVAPFVAVAVVLLAATFGPAANAPGVTVAAAVAGVNGLAPAVTTGAVTPFVAVVPMIAALSVATSPAPLITAGVGYDVADEFTVTSGFNSSAGFTHCPVGEAETIPLPPSGDAGPRTRGWS